MKKREIAKIASLGALLIVGIGIKTEQDSQLQARENFNNVQGLSLDARTKKNQLLNDKLIELPDLSGFTESDTVLEEVITTEDGEMMSYFVGPSINIGESVTRLVPEKNGSSLQIMQPNMTKIDDRGRRTQHIYGGEQSLQTSTNLLMSLTPPGQVPKESSVYEARISKGSTLADFSYGYKLAENGLKTFKLTYKTEFYVSDQKRGDWPPAGFPEEPLEVNMVITGLPEGFAVVDYYVTNTSDQPIENFSLMKTVDTQLGYNDMVIPRAMGNDMGVYIDNAGEKLFYIFNQSYTKNPPENWLGSKFSGPLLNRIFGPLNTDRNGPSFETISSLGQEKLGLTIGAPYFDYEVDSAMVMKNSPMTLPAGGTTGFSYAVSLVTPVNQLSINPPKALEYDGKAHLKVNGSWVDTEAGKADLYYQVGDEPEVKFASQQENGAPGGINSFEVYISKDELKFDADGQAKIKFRAVNITTNRESKVSETAVQLLKKKITVRYLFDDTKEEIAPSIATELFAGTSYSYPEIKIPGYSYDYTDGESSGVLKGEDISINHYYLVGHYDLKIDGQLADKTPALAAKQGETIDYALTLQSKIKNRDRLYQDVDFKASLPEYLTDFSDLQFVYLDEEDKEQKAGTVVLTGQELSTKLSSDQIPSSQDLIVRFKARVKPTAPVGGQLSVAFDVNGRTSDGQQLQGEAAPAFVTTILESPLELISVPDAFDFGDVTLNGRAQLISLKGMNQDVKVRDTLKGRQWELSVELSKEFTGAKTKQELKGLMKFKQGEVITEFGKGNQVKIASNQTEDDGVVNISKEWIANKEGFVLDFSSDNNAYAEDDYSATMTWHLIQAP